ncbi:MAG: pitrilysin family protein [Deltaproteobacteria bacterium]|nr:pitrilysin family protein [Deltaproteobacteria bacterium]
MTWIIVNRPQVPVFSGIVMVRAGGVDEPVGKTGLAHMFEHMAFKGSKTIGTKNYTKEVPILKKIAVEGQKLVEEQKKEKPDAAKIAEIRQNIQKLTEEEHQYMVKNEVWQTLSQKGAEDLNAFTTKDVTAYHASMLATQFPLWARITSEIILDPVLREFYQERDVVMEERRMRYDNNPQGFMIEALEGEAFPESSPYHWSPIGSWKDLKGLTMEDAEAFHKKYYVPSNMVGVLVGDITSERAKPELEKTFGKFPAGALPVDHSYPSYAFQGEKRKTIYFPAEPFLLMAFHKPKAPAREDYVFDMLVGLLCEGRTGLFYKKLVEEKKMASDISCSGSFPGSRLENLFIIMASPMKGHSLQELEAAVNVELEAIGKNVSSGELEKVRLAVTYNFLWGLEDNFHFAEQLASAQAVLKDWRYVTTYGKVIESITADEIQKTAEKYFKADNRVVIYRLRGKK